MPRIPYSLPASQFQAFKSDICDAQIFRAFFPCAFLCIERDAYDFKSFRVELFVGFLYVRHFRTAWAAPTGPKIYQDIVPFTYVVGQLVGRAFHVIHGKIREHATDGFTFQGCHVLVYFIEASVVFVGVRFQIISYVLVFKPVSVDRDEEGRNQIVFVFLQGLPDAFGLPLYSFIKSLLQPVGVSVRQAAIVALCDIPCFYLQFFHLVVIRSGLFLYFGVFTVQWGAVDVR